MESESKYVGIYHNIYKSGLINKNDTKISSELSHQNIIPLSRVNQFFFGTNLFSKELNYLVLHRDSMITKRMGIYWLYTSKLEQYLNEVCSVIKIETNINCCPYNYLKTFGKTNVHPNYHTLVNSIENFLNFLNNKNTNDAKTIINIMAPNSKNGNYKLEGEVVDMLKLGDITNNNMVLKFDKKGNPLFITLSWETSYKMKVPSNILVMRDNVDSNVDSEEYEHLYNYICKQLRMDTPEEFLINNLDRVCGSREFSEIMVKSYLAKKEFLYPLEIISSIILWKNSNSQQKYEQYFLSRYKDSTNISDCQILLNFEAINKFLLNITEDDVESFHVKEQINDMYYNCMNELINSFELLYKNK
jgi:hypothetical protein